MMTHQHYCFAFAFSGKLQCGEGNVLQWSIGYDQQAFKVGRVHRADQKLRQFLRQSRVGAIRFRDALSIAVEIVAGARLPAHQSVTEGLNQLLDSTCRRQWISDEVVRIYKPNI